MAHNSNRFRAGGEALLGRALRLREALFGQFGHERETNAYRLIHGEGDDLPGLAVDAYAGHLVVHVLEAEAQAASPELERALVAALQPRSVVRKLRFQATGRGKVADEVVAGEAPPGALEVTEAKLTFEVHLRDGFHTGLFTDLREEHVRLRNLSRDRRVLNTFSYTGAFSVAAAAGGARQVTSVDVVAKPLAQAKRNFVLSGLDPTPHHFARMEVLEHLALSARRGWRYDAIVLDPPTFATFKTGRWSARTDYPQLLDAAISVLDPGGLLWAVANTESLPQDSFERMVADAFRRARRTARVLAVGGLPPDYPTPADQPRSRYLKVLVIEA